MEEIKPAGLEKNLRKRDRNGNNGTNVIISQAKEINIHRFQQGIRYIVKKVILGVFDISQNETRMEEAC